jgi:hypothetical protein
VAIVLAGCGLFDSPTRITLGTPVSVAADGDVVIFKVATDSYACVLRGGTVSLAGSNEHPSDSGVVRFAYVHSSDLPRNDIVSFTTGAHTLEISGRQTYRIGTSGADRPWRALRSVSPHGERLAETAASGISITPRGAGAYLIKVTRRSGQDVFTGTAIPRDGNVYLRQAVFTPVVGRYDAESQHDCGNWNSPYTAARALRRVEDRIPN